MHAAIAQHKAGIAEICERFGICRLEVVGSGARGDDVDPLSSDADFLVEFGPDARRGLYSYFGAKAELERLLGRGVDLIELGAVRNPFVLAGFERDREVVFST